MYWLHQDENCRKTHCGKGELDAFCPEHVAHHQARVSGALVPVHPVSKIRVWYDKNKTADKRGIPGQTTYKQPQQTDRDQSRHLDNQPLQERQTHDGFLRTCHVTSCHSKRAELYVLTDSCSTQLGGKIGQALTRSIQDLIADNTSCVLQPPEQPHVVFNAKSGTLG